jgi:hypothetical protein
MATTHRESQSHRIGPAEAKDASIAPIHTTRLSTDTAVSTPMFAHEPTLVPAVRGFTVLVGGEILACGCSRPGMYERERVSC